MALKIKKKHILALKGKKNIYLTLKSVNFWLCQSTKKEKILLCQDIRITLTLLLLVANLANKNEAKKQKND